MSDRLGQSTVFPPSTGVRKGSRTSAIGRSRLKSYRWVTGYLLVAPPVLYLFALSIFPLIYTLRLSVMDQNQGTWVFVGLSNYATTLADPWFWADLLNSAEFTIPSVVLHLAIGLALAVMVNRVWFSISLRNLVRGLLILPWIFSTAAAALIWSLMFHPFGIFNWIGLSILHLPQAIDFLGTPGLAMASLVLVNTWKSYPFYMLAILGSLQSIPIELYEAAKVDGANAWGQFRFITLPQLRTILAAISTIDIISTFGHVDLMKIMTQGGPFRSTETISYYVYQKGFGDGDLGNAAAISTLVLLALAIMAVVYLRTVFRSGETDGTGF
ncbi:MAG: carbohydrate ABC transporter permease [Chloroflexota bacterium]